jgi:hypothetical protein
MNEPAAPVTTRAAYNSPKIWVVTCGQWSGSSGSGRSSGGVGGGCTGSPRVQGLGRFPIGTGSPLT